MNKGCVYECVSCLLLPWPDSRVCVTERPEAVPDFPCRAYPANPDESHISSTSPTPTHTHTLTYTHSYTHSDLHSFIHTHTHTH